MNGRLVLQPALAKDLRCVVETLERHVFVGEEVILTREDLGFLAEHVADDLIAVRPEIDETRWRDTDWGTRGADARFLLAADFLCSEQLLDGVLWGSRGLQRCRLIGCGASDANGNTARIFACPVPAPA